MSYGSSPAPRANFGLRGHDGSAVPALARGLGGEAAKREADNMKRTMVLTLVALGAGSAGLYFFANSGGPTADTPRVYKSVVDCVSARIQPAGACEQQWNAANLVHQKGAPDYASMEVCEKQHGAGKCVKPATPEDAERASRYIPIMSGYFFGKAPQGTFQGVPLYSILSDGAERYRVAEIRPKEPVDPVNSLEKSKTAGNGEGGQGGTSRTLLFIPGLAIGATGPAAAPAAAAAPANAARPGAMPASPTSPAATPANTAPRAQMGNPAAATKPAATTTSRGGLGSAARSASAGGSGG